MVNDSFRFIARGKRAALVMVFPICCGADLFAPDEMVYGNKSADSGWRDVRGKLL